MSALVAPHIELRDGPGGLRLRIAGKNILVRAIVSWHQILGLSPEEISAEYELTLAEVHGALAYYYDHRDEVDTMIRTDEQFVSEMKQKSPSLLAAKIRKRFGA